MSPNPQEVHNAARLLKGLEAAGLDLFPLGIKSKQPRDKGFLLHDYGKQDFADWFRKGGNWGIRARAGQLIMDVDPKNGGDLSFAMLQWEVGDDFSSYPYTVTGSGGRHIFMTRPAEGRWYWHLPGYPGIDFQGLGRYVVAPGSTHPETGRKYTFHPPRTELERPLLAPAPEKLLTMLRKPDFVKRDIAGAGELSERRLAMLLRRLDPKEFGVNGKHHDEWLDMAMACHFVTAGEGREVWLDWCAGDPSYGDSAREMNGYRWDSFEDSREDGITYKTFMRAIARVSKRLVARTRLKHESARAEFGFEADADDGDHFPVDPDDDY